MSLASVIQAARRPHLPRAGRFALAATLALALAGCFQPMYGDHSAGNAPGLRDKLAAIAIPPIDVPNGSPVRPGRRRDPQRAVRSNWSGNAGGDRRSPPISS